MKNGILQKFFGFFKEWREQRRCTVPIPYPEDFNWDKVNRAASRSASPEELDELLKDTELTEREKGIIYNRVALNPNTFPKTLIELSKSENPKVRDSVALNPSAPFEALTQLSKDEIKCIRTYAEYRLAEMNSQKNLNN